MAIALETAKHLIGWTRVDEESLPQVQPLLEAYAPRILEEFWVYVEEGTEISAFWAERSTDARAKIRARVHDWLANQLARPPDEALIQWALESGRIASERGAPALYMVSTLEWFRRRLFELIRMGMGPEGAAVARALGKMFDLTIALTMEGYAEGWRPSEDASSGSQA